MAVSPNPVRTVLILFAHPALEKSRVNRVLVRGITGLSGITFHDLYEAYPDLHIDVAREQDLLTRHDIVVMHHPLYWYSTPAILKEWQDLVLEHGWAYGREGTALLGKTMLNVVTSGGREEAYRLDGYNRMPVRQLLAPIERTAALCGMEYLAPFVVHGTHAMQPPAMEAHAQEYRRLLTALGQDRLDRRAGAAEDLPLLNHDLDRLIGGGD